MTNIAIITARGKNSSIPDKNIIRIQTKPAIEYVIQAAQKASLIKDVFISTDCEKISKIGKRLKCVIIKRPLKLCLPNANHGDVILHAVKLIKNKYYPDIDIVTVLLGNTVMVSSKLIDLSIGILKKRKNVDSVMSVWQAQDDHPYRALRLNDEGFLKSFLDIKCQTSRQSYPKVYFYDQGVWTFRWENIFREEGPNPWWWMGKNCFPIVRRWITGRDFHSKLDVDFSKYWIKFHQQDAMENMEEIKALLLRHQ